MKRFNYRAFQSKRTEERVCYELILWLLSMGSQDWAQITSMEFPWDFLYQLKVLKMKGFTSLLHIPKFFIFSCEGAGALVLVSVRPSSSWISHSLVQFCPALCNVGMLCHALPCFAIRLDWISCMSDIQHFEVT